MNSKSKCFFVSCTNHKLKSFGLSLLFSAFIVWEMLVLQIEFQSEEALVKHPEHKSRHFLYPSDFRLLNLPKFRFIINNNVCEEKTPTKMLIIITSNARNLQLRHSQRAAYPSHLIRRFSMRRIFLLAKDPITQDLIERENRAHKDIVQGDFHESYHNLTYKHIMGLKWAARFCSEARYILKMDDDIAVDYFQLFAKVESDYPDLDAAMLGYKQIGLFPQRDKKSKWYVSRSQYPRDVYPNFLSGWAYVTSPKVAGKVVEAAENGSFFWIDDIWVTGIIAGEELKVKLLSLNTLFTVYVDHLKCCLKSRNSSQNLWCDFVVGPSMDDGKVIEELGELSTKCQLNQNCQRRIWETSVMKTCVNVDNPLFLPNSQGIGQVIKISNKI